MFATTLRGQVNLRQVLITSVRLRAPMGRPGPLIVFSMGLTPPTVRALSPLRSRVSTLGRTLIVSICFRGICPVT